MRTYTVRQFDSKRQEVDVDFALHESPGPATRWALAAKPGDKVGFKGPGAPKPLNLLADWVLLAGDMSALPAISALLESSPGDTRGHVFIEVQSEEDKQTLLCPDNIELHWLINSRPTVPNSLLSDAVKALPWSEGRVAVWIAGESSMVRELRKYCRDERGVGKDFMYAAGYWQIGLTEDRHQIIKRQEND